jgi:hypothetical protein
MPDLVLTLLPLAAGSALVPIQIIITILLLRSASGRVTAVAWVAGMTAVRLIQGVVFGLILGSRGQGSTSGDEPSLIVSVLLLVVAVIFYVVAAKQLLRQPDEDAPPPRWMALLDGVTPAKAFLLGLGLIAVGVKFWVFTLGAIAAIGAAGLGLTEAVIAFLLFVAAAESIHLAILAVALAAPAHADAMLGRFSEFLKRQNRAIMIVLGLVFGTWFLLKALDGRGIL